MTKLRHERARASITTLRRVVTTKKPVMMVWPHDAGSQADPVLVDVLTAQKLCDVYQHQESGVQAEMEKMVASRRATFESLYRQLFNGLATTESDRVGKGPMSGEPMLIDVLMAHRDAKAPLETLAKKQAGGISRPVARFKAFCQSTCRQLAGLSW